jgi:hypothetical protein
MLLHCVEGDHELARDGLVRTCLPPASSAPRGQEARASARSRRVRPGSWLRRRRDPCAGLRPRPVYPARTWYPRAGARSSCGRLRPSGPSSRCAWPLASAFSSPSVPVRRLTGRRNVAPRRRAASCSAGSRRQWARSPGAARGNARRLAASGTRNAAPSGAAERGHRGRYVLDGLATSRPPPPARHRAERRIREPGRCPGRPRGRRS